ncbi:MAG: 16S rRNA (cytidine(1402)-2'-O)-methyltransferase [Halofilum sp. (in: g-proteobacteria)]|nr:16S rRNA (cytidine(1402)-2'-O)-methyltransferase [Halofilum sp. (in: g-proteobacteria)]
MSIEPGALHVVATPIGNRDDLTDRARAVLAGVDVVAAEDTRHTGRFLKALGIDAELVSLHEHNERARIPALLERLRAGAAVALVSDAGTPAIGDPGYPLVVAAHEAGIRVLPIPGPSALSAALSVAGQPTDRFAFEGFLPARAQARRKRLDALADEARTLVLYESAQRVVAALDDLVAAFGATRPATLARELTKAFETVRRADLGTLAEWVRADPDQRRGEIVLVVAGAAASAGETARVTLAAALDALLPELPPARAAAVAARLTGTSRRAAYDAALARGQRGD